MGQYVESKSRDRDAYLLQAEKDYIDRRQTRNATMQKLASTIQQKRNIGILGKEDVANFNVDGYGAVLQQGGNTTYQDLFALEKSPLNHLGKGVSGTIDDSDLQNMRKVQADDEVKHQLNRDKDRAFQEAILTSGTQELGKMVNGQPLGISESNLAILRKLKGFSEDMIKNATPAQREYLNKIAEDARKEQELEEQAKVQTQQADNKVLLNNGMVTNKGTADMWAGVLDIPNTQTQVNTTNVEPKVLEEPLATAKDNKGNSISVTPGYSAKFTDRFKGLSSIKQNIGSGVRIEADMGQSDDSKEYKAIVKSTKTTDPFLLDPVGFDYMSLMSNALASDINQFVPDTKGAELYKSMADKAIEYRDKFNKEMSTRGTVPEYKIEDLGKRTFKSPSIKLLVDSKQNVAPSTTFNLDVLKDAKLNNQRDGNNGENIEKRSAWLGPLNDKGGKQFDFNFVNGRTNETQLQNVGSDAFWKAWGGKGNAYTNITGIKNRLTQDKVTGFTANFLNDGSNYYRVVLQDGTTVDYKELGSKTAGYSVDVRVHPGATQEGLATLKFFVDRETNKLEAPKSDAEQGKGAKELEEKKKTQEQIDLEKNIYNILVKKNMKVKEDGATVNPNTPEGKRMLGTIKSLVMNVIEKDGTKKDASTYIQLLMEQNNYSYENILEALKEKEKK